jgi:hypothetical protein
MTTNKELLEAREKFRKLTPSKDPASEYQVTLALIKKAEADRKLAADKLAKEKDKEKEKVKYKTKDEIYQEKLANHIQLIENIDQWNQQVDLCIIDIHQNPRLKMTLDYWTTYIKSNGYIMAHLYDETVCPTVYQEINNLIQQGWKLVRKVDKLVLIQKS